MSTSRIPEKDDSQSDEEFFDCDLSLIEDANFQDVKEYSSVEHAFEERLLNMVYAASCTVELLALDGFLKHLNANHYTTEADMLREDVAKQHKEAFLARFDEKTMLTFCSKVRYSPDRNLLYAEDSGSGSEIETVKGYPRFIVSKNTQSLWRNFIVKFPEPSYEEYIDEEKEHALIEGDNFQDVKEYSSAEHALEERLLDMLYAANSAVELLALDGFLKHLNANHYTTEAEMLRPDIDEQYEEAFRARFDEKTMLAFCSKVRYSPDRNLLYAEDLGYGSEIETVKGYPRFIVSKNTHSLWRNFIVKFPELSYEEHVEEKDEHTPNMSG